MTHSTPQPPAGQLFTDALHAELAPDAVELSHEETQAALQRFRNRIATSAPLPARPRASRPLAWAAGLSVAAILGILASTILSSADRETVPITREYATTRAQQATFTLPDGSTVHLGPESHLSYSSASKSGRVLSLRGEARFVVAHDPQHPLSVQTPASLTQVLGTTFDVRDYGNGQAAEVSLIEGRVSTRSTQNGQASELILLPGYAAHLTDSGATRTDAAVLSTRIDWQAGRLVFKDAPVPAVLATVGRWYGYAFKLADSSIARKYVTTTLVLSQSSESLQLLKDLLDVQMTFRGDTITLQSSGTAPRVPAPSRTQRHALPEFLETGR